MSLLNLTKINDNYNLKVKGVAHFGAHLGEEVKDYKKLNFTNIHLFEPQKKLFKKLEKSFSIFEDIYLYNVGLGEKKITTEIYLSPSNEGASASLLKASGHLEYHPEIIFEGKESVEIYSYDEFDLKNVNFLNIDIQGYELEALKGSENSLKNYIDYISIEISRKEMYEGAILKNELDNFLENFEFIRVSTRWASSKTPWGDAFYVKKTEVYNYKKILLFCNKFFEEFNFYYLFIDPYRKFDKWKYKTKQNIKKKLKF
jgi:FkbM family methyltransferase